MIHTIISTIFTTIVMLLAYHLGYRRGFNNATDSYKTLVQDQLYYITNKQPKIPSHSYELLKEFCKSPFALEKKTRKELLAYIEATEAKALGGSYK